MTMSTFVIKTLASILLKWQCLHLSQIYWWPFCWYDNVCICQKNIVGHFVDLMVLNATFNNISVISWRSVLLVEETGGPGENQRPVASHWQSDKAKTAHRYGIMKILWKIYPQIVDLTMSTFDTKTLHLTIKSLETNFANNYIKVLPEDCHWVI